MVVEDGNESVSLAAPGLANWIMSAEYLLLLFNNNKSIFSIQHGLLAARRRVERPDLLPTRALRPNYPTRRLSSPRLFPFFTNIQLSRRVPRGVLVPS